MNLYSASVNIKVETFVIFHLIFNLGTLSDFTFMHLIIMVFRLGEVIEAMEERALSLNYMSMLNWKGIEYQKCLKLSILSRNSKS
jgi:hypothetical protein